MEKNKEYQESVDLWKKNQELQISFVEVNLEYNKKMIRLHSEQLAINIKSLEAEKELLRAGLNNYNKYLETNLIA